MIRPSIIVIALGTLIAYQAVMTDGATSSSILPMLPSLVPVSNIRRLINELNLDGLTDGLSSTLSDALSDLASLVSTLTALLSNLLSDVTSTLGSILWPLLRALTKIITNVLNMTLNELTSLIESLYISDSNDQLTSIVAKSATKNGVNIVKDIHRLLSTTIQQIKRINSHRDDQLASGLIGSLLDMLGCLLEALMSSASRLVSLINKTSDQVLNGIIIDLVENLEHVLSDLSEQLHDLLKIIPIGDLLNQLDNTIREIGLVLYGNNTTETNTAYDTPVINHRFMN